PPLEKTHNLVLVASIEPELIKAEPPPPPRRLIVDDDPSLNYLDSISRGVCIDEESPNRAPAFRRLVASIFDIIICSLLSAPIALAVHSQEVRAGRRTFPG